MNDGKYLNCLIGKKLTSVSLGTSTTIPINVEKDIQQGVILTIANILYFGQFRLDINNPISFIPGDKKLEDLIGFKVIATDERKEVAELIFESGFRLLVNMRDEAYYDPEAMCLSGPNGFCVVWN